MRTKALLLAAALSAAGIATSMAQVYSVNAVGYVNLNLAAGWNIIANPLNGTNNSLSTIMPLPDAADGTMVYRYDSLNTHNYLDPITFYANPDDPGHGFWFTAGDPNTMVINPGEGFFIKCPAAMTVTFVGEVPQGSLSTPIPGGNYWKIAASQVPQALALGDTSKTNTLQFPAADGDMIYIFDAATQNYKDPYTYYVPDPSEGPPFWFSFSDPNPDGPVIPVGTGFWVRKPNAAAPWNRTFTVN